MSLNIAYYPKEHRLDIRVEGNLDLTLTSRFLEACKLVDVGVLICVIDVTRVRRVFDSGLGMLMLLKDRLARYQVKPIIVGNIAGLMLHPLPESLGSTLLVSSERHPASETSSADVGVSVRSRHSPCIPQHQSAKRRSTMIKSSQSPDVCTNRDHQDGLLPAAQIDFPPAETEHHTDHEYLPMDVFVSPVTIRKHFQHDLSLPEERSRIRSAAA